MPSSARHEASIEGIDSGGLLRDGVRDADFCDCLNSSYSRMLLEWTISDEDDECEYCQDKRKILKKTTSNLYTFPVVLG